jgi:HSP20 family protein
MAIPDSRASKDSLTLALGKLVGLDAKEPLSSLPEWEAPYDVKESLKELAIIVDLPGVDEDEIDIREENNSIRIAAAREFNHDLEDAEEYTSLARPYGAFICKVPVPITCNTDKMTAKYRRGVLKVRIPKA